MRRFILLTTFAALCLAASGARCQHTEKGKGRCVGTALKGEQYCKKHHAAHAKEKERLCAIRDAMNFWRKSRRGTKWVANFNGHNVAISADGQIILSRDQPMEYVVYDGKQYTIHEAPPNTRRTALRTARTKTTAGRHRRSTKWNTRLS